ncbi:MAG TPA: SRPBCC family protein [Candidatus Limnocylindrales bacterium]|nr:SRPBCC family protein [Candidatus Limnocylindrales bacterium]
MTIAVEVETAIARSPEDVFAELIAIERFPDWLVASGIVGVERLDEGPPAVGSRVRISQRVAGRSTVLEGSITELEAGRSLGLRGRDPDGVTIEIDAAIATDGPGTRLRWSLRIGVPLRFRMLESMVAPQVRRAVTLDLEAFRRRMESTAGG